MMSFWFHLGVLILFFNSIGSGQSSDLFVDHRPGADSVAVVRESASLTTKGAIVGNDLLVGAKILGNTFSAPLRWGSEDWIRAVGISAMTIAATFVDEDGLNLMDRNRTSFNDRSQRIVVEYGSGFNLLLFTGGMYGGGLIFENAWLRETALLIGTSLIVSGSVELSLKVGIGRARPYTELGHKEFRFFEFEDRFLSFPSGHTVVAFTLSAVLSERIGNPWASAGLYGVATLSSVSRMYSRNHWFSDVLFSAMLSTCVAKSVVAQFESIQSASAEKSSFKLIPTGNGLTVIWEF